MTEFIFKNDKYKKTRGGNSRLLNIHCQKCGDFLCSYQKDGPGSLRRMYVDRILRPKIFIIRKDLSCLKGHLIGVKIIYKKENRPAFRLIGDSFTKKIVKSV